MRYFYTDGCEIKDYDIATLHSKATVLSLYYIRIKEDQLYVKYLSLKNLFLIPNNMLIKTLDKNSLRHYNLALVARKEEYEKALLKGWDVAVSRAITLVDKSQLDFSTVFVEKYKEIMS